MHDFITERFRYLEQLGDLIPDLSLRILFACESGSRAWGFASANSDYDVRFVYISPLRRYVTQRDVLEPDDIRRLWPEHFSDTALYDFSGWDLWKFFGLAAKSNPVAFEWLQTTIIYREWEPLWTEVRKTLQGFYSPKAAIHHYRSMAKHNYREHMRDGQVTEVPLKKYLYITRPLLCCRWIENHGTPPPMRMEKLLEDQMVPPGKLANELQILIERKRAGEELGRGQASPLINRFIDQELERLPAVADAAPTAHGDVALLNALFRKAVDLYMSDKFL